MRLTLRFRVGLAVLMTGAMPTCVYAQSMPAGTWMAHTSARQVSDVSVSGSAIWAASSGGIFGYDASSGEISRYTAAEGLHEVEARAIAYDPHRESVWTGYSDGVLDHLDLQSGKVTTFFDIQRSDRFPAKAINRMVVHGDSLLVATDFGLVVFDAVRGEVRDTYSRLGSFAAATAVHDFVLAPLPDGATGLWLATQRGIAYARRESSSLQDPASWTVESAVLPGKVVRALEFYDGRLFVGTELGLGVRNPAGGYSDLRLTTRPVESLALLDGRLLAIDPFRLFEINAASSARVVVGGFLDLQRVAIDEQGNIWLADAQSGLNQYAWSPGTALPELVRASVYPDGPFDAPFGDLELDGAGNLWAAGVLGASGTGFYRMSSAGQWTNFTTRFVAELEGLGSFWRVHADNHGHLWAPSRGGGLAHVSPADAVTVYNNTNSTLLPAAGTQNYIIVHGAASEPDGTLWVTNTTAAMPLHVRTPDGSWTALPPPVCAGSAQTTGLGSLMVDSNGIKWIVLQSLGNLNQTTGIMVLDTQDTPTDPSDDMCQVYDESGANGVGLPESQILSIAEDLAGRIWIGTSGGPAYFLASPFAATDQALRATWPVWADRSIGSYVLNGLAVNDIGVDPSNRLWMATNRGVYLLAEQDGIELVQHFRANDSPLFSDMVTTIAVDAGTGRIFLGTDKGLLSYQGDAISPSESARDLFIYPNPVRIEGNTAPEVFIEGLVAETEITVLAAHGTLVQRFQARGGRVRWDAKDRNGELVPSGMYLIVASGKNGEGTAYGKVAIIR